MHPYSIFDTFIEKKVPKRSCMFVWSLSGTVLFLFKRSGCDASFKYFSFTTFLKHLNDLNVVNVLNILLSSGTGDSGI